MRDEMDFSQYDVNGDGFDNEPRFRKIHRESLPSVITGGVRVDRSHNKVRGVKFTEIFTPPVVSSRLLAHSEVAVFENGEASAIHFLVEKIKSQDIIQLAFQMQMLLGLQLETIYMQMCAAWLRDTADEYIDEDGIDEGNHYRWAHRYPRLTDFAKTHYEEFRKFQEAISKFLVLPDLEKPQKTAKEIKAQRDTDFVAMRKEYDRKHPNLSKAA
ncbi:hypothetical protein A2662_00810 [Candidatus Giovannonibacteria bacterium RIFCSPHIGHO2_01_FULL_45_33]|uniref:Uncharacterized protein n=1 Tax=Candidatus Giovannonibacteria bacterium RIFCSPLOWO2_01_FULL_45_34 TaxID=1798351 RepID=A0A1F5WXY8_9BACT|nr:MAG: hypothetical protein A2662_00810 [Candidatus Giovannonibacteria bacterium RIFCSPHIGHO2_01_FULL_45_33]OGF80516.1 MAG: hypothetical protein A2930_02705 [Candidatus Giovannonibacteria bacterium RIFCSPLOWO2_01_FULL_45_34]